MNTDVAKALLFALETENVDMSGWFLDDYGDDIEPSQVLFENRCFTSACAAGWLVALYREQALAMWDKAREDRTSSVYGVYFNEVAIIGMWLLEIKRDEADNLFYNYNRYSVIKYLQDEIHFVESENLE